MTASITQTAPEIGTIGYKQVQFHWTITQNTMIDPKC